VTLDKQIKILGKIRGAMRVLEHLASHFADILILSVDILH
jgi:hypothetical protein